jgi:hypothetical protein
MGEWLKPAVLKTVILRKRDRGFESLSLRHGLPGGQRPPVTGTIPPGKASGARLAQNQKAKNTARTDNPAFAEHHLMEEPGLNATGGCARPGRKSGWRLAGAWRQNHGQNGRVGC